MQPSEVINYILKRESLKAAQLAKKIGITPTQIYDLQKGKIKKISNSIAEKITNTLPQYNWVWLVTGEGSPMADVTEINHSKSIEKIEEEQQINLYDLEAAANLQTLLLNKDQNIIGQIKIPNIPKCDGAVYVKGDSMYPLLKSGDIVAYREITLDIQHIIFGEMYLVSIDMDGDEYLAVKYIHHSEKGDDWIKLVSYNPHHEPKDFPLSSVRALALVKLSIRMNTMI